MTRARVGLLAAALLVVTLGGLFLINTVPAPLAMADREAGPDGVFVIKLHAQWCPVCLVTQSAWRRVSTEYAGRVHLLVFDFTTTTTTEASRREAVRLGLEDVFDDNAGWTGTILIVPGRTRRVTASLHGRHRMEDYRAAIDAALQGGG